MNIPIDGRKAGSSRGAAVIEVLSAFAITQLGFKALKQLTSIGAYERAVGLNFTPGVIMALAAVLCVRVVGSNWRIMGLQPVGPLQSRSWRFVLIAVYALSLAIFVRFSAADPRIATLVFFGHIASTAVGEELFFRGYIQSRLNEVFGRPFRIGAVQVGIGLFVSACLFSVMHGLNTVDYFRGHYVFAWRWAGVTLATGLVYGFIREKSGSIIPCMIVHGLTNVWALSIQMIARS
jgi:membrane protease YdiL (CAAX protease family)